MGGGLKGVGRGAVSVSVTLERGRGGFFSCGHKEAYCGWQWINTLLFRFCRYVKVSRTTKCPRRGRVTRCVSNTPDRFRFGVLVLSRLVFLLDT